MAAAAQRRPLVTQQPERAPDGRRVVKAVLPFVAIPVIIAAYVFGRAGISAIVAGAVLMWMFVPDFLRGNAYVRTGAYRSSSGTWIFARGRFLSGLPARIYTARYLLVGLVLVVGGATETSTPGRAQAFYASGGGWGWTMVLVAALLAMSAMVSIALSRAGDDAPPSTRITRSIQRLLATGLLLAALVLLGVGLSELAAPGWLAGKVRDAVGPAR